VQSGIFIPAGPIDQPSFTYCHREEWSIDALREMLNGAFVEGINLGLGQFMYVDEDGQQNNLPINGIASALYHRRRGGNVIVGNALVLGVDRNGENCSVSHDTVLLVAKIATAMTTEGNLNELA